MLHHFTAKNHFGLKLQHGMAFCRCCWLLLFLAVYYWGNSIVTLDNESWLILGAILPRLRSFLGSLKGFSFLSFLSVASILVKIFFARFFGQRPYLHAFFIIISNSLITFGCFYVEVLKIVLFNSPFTIIFYNYLFFTFLSEKLVSIGFGVSFFFIPNIVISLGSICYNIGNIIRIFLPEKVSIIIPSIVFIQEALPLPEPDSGSSSSSTGNFNTNFNQQNVFQFYNIHTRRTFFRTRLIIAGDTRVFLATTTILGGAFAIGSAFWIAEDTNAKSLALAVFNDNQRIIDNPKSTFEEITKAHSRFSEIENLLEQTINPWIRSEMLKVFRSEISDTNFNIASREKVKKITTWWDDLWPGNRSK